MQISRPYPIPREPETVLKRLPGDSDILKRLRTTAIEDDCLDQISKNTSITTFFWHKTFFSSLFSDMMVGGKM
jgi:hypothetical protein